MMWELLHTKYGITLKVQHIAIRRSGYSFIRVAKIGTFNLGILLRENFPIYIQYFKVTYYNDSYSGPYNHA